MTDSGRERRDSRALEPELITDPQEGVAKVAATRAEAAEEAAEAAEAAPAPAEATGETTPGE